MKNYPFKLTALTLSIFTTYQAQAALYNVIEVAPPSSLIKSTTTSSEDGDYYSVIGSSIQDSDTDSSTALADSCFSNSAQNANSVSTSCSNFLLAGETRTRGTMAGLPVDGVSFREEAPFGIDNAFSYVQTEADFRNYCTSQLLYATCSDWASVNWSQWYKELSGVVKPTAIAFLENSNTYDLSNNTVTNQVTSDGSVVGIKSSLGNSRTTVSAIAPVLPASDSSYSKSRAWKTDGTYTVGSVSSDYTNGYGDHYSSKAAIWQSGSAPVQIAWPSGKEEKSDRLAQGSMRDFVVKDSVIYGVGFNTWDSSNNYMNATVFTVNESDVATSSNWSSKLVNNAQVKVGGDYVYSNTLLTGINNNLVAIGEAKRAGSVPSDGAAANRPFIVSDVSNSSLTATFFAGDITFSEAGGKAMAINDYNEIVGQIDTESTRESSGKPRRKRGFIYPYNGTGSQAERRAIFNNRGWLLDDLTNDGSVNSTNNAYRILSANDINDAGVIAATAIKCSGGYDSTTHDSPCGNGSKQESTVAVKLVPIVGATSSDIVQRGYETSSSASRSGASIGYFVLGLLSFVLMGRKRKFL